MSVAACTCPVPTPPPELVDLAACVRRLHQQGWTPATSSNFSHRPGTPNGGFWVSRSGLDKGDFQAEHFLPVDAKGEPLDPAQGPPSAETRVHATIYRHQPDARYLLHIHSHNASVVSRLAEPRGELVLSGWELQKALRDVTTHEAVVRLPVFPNTQDMRAFSETLDACLAQRADDPPPGVLLAGHGLYTWGRTLAEAARHVEALDFLLGCELSMMACGASPNAPTLPASPR